MSNKHEMLGVHIRSAVEQDAPDISELCVQLGYSATKLRIAARLKHVLQQPHHAVFVAEQANKPLLGWIHIRRVSTLILEQDGEIDGFVVREEFRNRGIGSKLLRRAEKWAAQNGCPSLRLRTNVKRQEAHRFYDRRGFERVKTSYLFEKPLDE